MAWTDVPNVGIIVLRVIGIRIDKFIFAVDWSGPSLAADEGDVDVPVVDFDSSYLGCVHVAEDSTLWSLIWDILSISFSFSRVFWLWLITFSQCNKFGQFCILTRSFDLV